MEPVTGLIVCATAGRDQGKYFMVVGCDDRFVLLADGKHRKLSHPKRKSRKHIRTTGACIAQEQITDKKLRDQLCAYTETRPTIGEVIKVV
jgi:ribosomal protein L14E/L6E/L27E